MVAIRGAPWWRAQPSRALRLPPPRTRQALRRRAGSARLVMPVDSRIELLVGRRHRHHRHHAAVLMREDMAMQHILAREVDEPAAHPEITGHHDLVSARVLDRL